MNKIGLIVGLGIAGILASAILSLLQAVVVYIGWGWFAPHVGLPELPFTGALGLAFILSAARSGASVSSSK